MKMLTHVLFTFALASLVCSTQIRDVWVLNNVFIYSLLINYFIDVFGHLNGKRTPLTHEVINNVSISLATGLIIHFIISHTVYIPALVVVATSVIASFTHLFLDLITGNIYLAKPLGLVKLNLSVGRYDDFALNTLFIFMSLVIVVLILTLIL
ncbi:MAG: DUF1286 domain-containing protein [Sulfolobales archaeon]|nr:DUF1286 domain-containing protein [Sulfolobales archaeon]MDW7969967.1 DUF1286 domain-containing protein [Sulfolobales archaeon]